MSDYLVWKVKQAYFAQATGSADMRARLRAVLRAIEGMW